MKILLAILILVFTCVTNVNAQQLHVDSTFFLGGDSLCGTISRYCLPTKDGGVLFIGYTTCSGSGNIPAVDTRYGSLIVKFDSNLQITWIKQYGIGGNTQIFGSCGVQTKDGGYAILGNTNYPDTIISGDHGTSDLWLFKLDSVGNMLWQKCYGSHYCEQPISIDNTPDNGFILLGTSFGTDGDVPIHYGDNWSSDWFIVKTDSAGNIQWTKDYGGSNIEGGGSIIAMNNGYYITGYSNSNDFDCNDDFWHINTVTDYYVLKLDTTGNKLWDSSYGGSNIDGAWQAIWDFRDSSIMSVGYTTSTDYMVTGNEGINGDMWVVKIDRNGKFIWQRCLGNNYGLTSGNSICIAPFGYIVYGSAFPGTIGQQNLCVYALDFNGNLLATKIYGGPDSSGYDVPAYIIPFKNGFLASGFTYSHGMNEGKNYGVLPNGRVGHDNSFLSYISFWQLGIDNIYQNNDVYVYPNPAYNNIHITAPYTGNMYITTIMGKVIYKQTVEDIYSNIDINTNNWASGIYLLKLQCTNGFIITKKIIIN